MGTRLHPTPLDGLLLLVVLIWGSNFSIVKVTIEEIPAFGFNTLRMAAAWIVLLTISRLNGEVAPDRGDWPRLITLGFFGHCCYQFAFVAGLERTTVANSSLILGCMPIAVLALNTLSGQPECVGKRQWLGIGFAVPGVYLVAGQGAGATTETLLGDALTMAALWSWAWYTTGSRALLQRYSPLRLSAYATLVGTLCYAPLRRARPAATRLGRGQWRGAGGARRLRAAGAFGGAHHIWYTGVQRLGSARTAVYGNLVPVTAMAVAYMATLRNEPRLIARWLEDLFHVRHEIGIGLRWDHPVLDSSAASFLFFSMRGMVSWLIDSTIANSTTRRANSRDDQLA
ncbi:MAG: DMT family transporter [Acidobacteria bacterium]|nr:DMT family transporter [Acidobacteriota bacterium]